MIRRRAPLKRSRKPIPRKRAKPRRGPLRDRGYLDFLKTEGQCVACRLARVTLSKAGFTAERGYKISFSDPVKQRIIDPAHGPVNGGSSKGPDNEAIPLCRLHHEEQTTLGWLAFGRKHGFNWMFEAAEQYARYELWKTITGVIAK